MGNEIRVQCPQCGMRSRSLRLGDAESNIAYCAACNRVVNSWRSRWRPLDRPQCRECGPNGHLRPLGTYDPAAAPDWGSGDFLCPCCGFDCLDIKLEAMVSFDFPQATTGTIIHCRVLTQPIEGVCQALMWPNTNVELSGAHPSHLHWWCAAEFEAETRKASLIEPIADSGLSKLEVLEVPELLRLNLTELQTAMSEGQPEARALWSFLTDRLPLVITESKVRLKLDGTDCGAGLGPIGRLLYEHSSTLLGLTHLWDPLKQEWLPTPPATVGLDFGCDEVLWLQHPWDALPQGPAYAKRISDFYNPGLKRVLVRDASAKIVNQMPPPQTAPPPLKPQPISEVCEQAKAGDAEAQFQLGLEYESGDSLEKNRSEALEWFTRAAEQGHGKAQWKVGKAYLEGIPLLLGSDPAKAVDWIDKAAEQRVPEALFAMGELYLKGIEVERDLTRARANYASAGYQGHELGLLLAGRMHLRGEGDYASHADGVSLLTRAADLGMLEAELDLAYLYQSEGDEEQARMWFKRAAMHGSREAEQILEDGQPDQESFVVRAVNFILSRSVNDGATKVNLRPPQGDKFLVEFLVEGEWQEVMDPSEQLFDAFLARFKILAGQDVQIRNEPQRGDIFLNHDGADYLVSCYFEPTASGQQQLSYTLTPE